MNASRYGEGSFGSRPNRGVSVAPADSPQCGPTLTDRDSILMPAKRSKTAANRTAQPPTPRLRRPRPLTPAPAARARARPGGLRDETRPQAALFLLGDAREAYALDTRRPQQHRRCSWTFRR